MNECTVLSRAAPSRSKQQKPVDICTKDTNYFKIQRRHASLPLARVKAKRFRVLQVTKVCPSTSTICLLAGKYVLAIDDTEGKTHVRRIHVD